MANLYLISQDENNDYDTWDAAVVVADSEAEAKLMHPSGDKVYRPLETWCSPEKVTVKLIGAAADDVVGVVCASFNAV